MTTEDAMLIEDPRDLLLDMNEPELKQAISFLENMAATFLTSTPGSVTSALPREEAVEASVVVASAATFILDDRGTILSFGEGAERLFGFDSREVTGRPFSALLAHGGLEPFVLTSGLPVPLALAAEAKGRRRDGSVFALELSAAELPLDGRTTFVVTARDAAETKRAADELKKSQARFKMLIEQIPAVTFMAALDEGLNEIYIGPQIEALLGFTQKEWLENPVIWFWQLHPEDRERWVQEFARGCQTGGPFRAETRFMAKDGRTVWVHGEARVIRDEDGRPRFIQGVAFDITDAKRAEQELREAQELKVKTERLSAIGQLAGGVAHDLRNPLGAIRNAWFYLGKKLRASDLAKSDARVDQLAGLVDSELGRCARIIGDLLDFARDRPPYRVATPLDQLVNDSLAVVAKPAATIQLVSELSSQLPIPYLDGDQFRQVLVNIVQNAAEAVDHAKGVVTVRARGEGDQVIIEIADNGKGIPPEIRAKIFEPLFTTKTKGTGLGLSIVDGIVRRHGGAISVTSEMGRGTTFTVRVPVGKPSEGPAPTRGGGAADLRATP